MCRPWEAQGPLPPAVAVRMTEVIRSGLLNCCQPKVLTCKRELMNHVKGLIFQTWPPAGKVPPVVWRSPDTWPQGSLRHLLCWQAGHDNTTLKLILWEVSFCVDSYQVRWPSFSFLACSLCGKVLSQNALKLGCNPSAVDGFKCKLLSWNTKSCWATNSQFNWKLVEYSRNVNVHVKIVCSCKITQEFQGWQKKGGTK